MKRYSREFLLSLADSENCQRPPKDLDPAVSRDSPSPEIVDCGVSSGPKFLHRRDRDYNHDLPEWRSRNSVNGGGLLSQQAPRRKNYDEDGPHGASFSSLYPSNLRSNAGRGAGQARWDIRSSIDKERERGGRHWDGAAPEHDGLLGSGGGLRGAYPGGGNRGPERGPDRFVGGGRGSRNNENDTRLNKFSGGFRNDSDALDGETFGEKNTTEDREEEERQRRESFEAMRKEQKRMKDERKRQEEKKSEEETRESRMPAPNTKHEPRPSVPPGFSHKMKEQKMEEAKQEKAEETSQPSKQPSDVVDPLAIACSNMPLTEEAVLKSESEISKFNITNSNATGFSTPQAERADATLNRTSSKFAHLFSFEDENSTTGLMSLFNSGAALQDANSPPLAFQTKPLPEAPQQGLMLPMPVGPSLEDIEKSFSNVAESNISQTHGSSNTPQTFLTCEDIEQSLLDEAKSETHNRQWPRFDNKPDANKEEDTNASRQLLSLLQKASLKPEDDHVGSKPATAESQSKELQETKDGTETKSATLETVFGMSFMMELLSTDAPLSAKVAAEASAAIGDYHGRTSSSTSDNNHLNWSATSSIKPELENNFAEHPPDIRNSILAAEISQPKEELDSSVLNDFLKFKKAMKHRNKVNDSFLGTSENSFVANDHPGDTSNTGSATVGPPANLYRSHSPPQINQKSNSLQLQQLQQVLASQSSLQQVLASQQSSRSSKQQQQQQQQQQQPLVNGDVSPAYARVRAAAALSRQQLQQQQQAMFDQAHLHHFHQNFLPPQTTSSSFHDHHHHLYSSKQQQQQQQRPSFFPPNGSNQQQTLANLNFPVPAMSYGHHPAIAGGFVGFPPPNDAAAAFLGGDLPGLAGGGGLDNRWINRGDHHHHVGLYQQQQQQQQPMYGRHELGFP